MLEILHAPNFIVAQPCALQLTEILGRRIIWCEGPLGSDLPSFIRSSRLDRRTSTNCTVVGGVSRCGRLFMKYGIFSGSYLKEDATWLESVEGLDAACDRMKKIANEHPGKYFIFSSDKRKAVGSIDTTDQSPSITKESGEPQGSPNSENP